MVYNGKMTKKERIYLTDITLHVRDYRPTTNFSKVAQKGRLYTPLPKPLSSKDPQNPAKYKFSFPLPKDLMEKHARGEVEIMIPKDGLYIFAGKDIDEYLEKKEGKERTQLIHRGRTWHSNDTGIK